MMRWHRWVRGCAAAMVAGVAAAACTPMPQEAPDPSPITAPRVDIPDDPDERTGSVFDEQRSMRLFEDRSARRTGDLITVVIEEETAGDRSINSEMARQQEADIPAPQIGGEDLEIFGRPFAFEQEGEASFEGGGSADQETNLTGTINAVVVDTTPNGHLVIRGEKNVRVSQGQETLRISGIVRTDDVGANNEVSSNRVANMQVGYTGEEALSDSAQPGWLTRFLMRRY
ncbi:MAG: flagellar basal body L-ring protein FlgH [Halorhodospira halophila]|uniref:flagellar basal body L-ring protein FlgH n=1 Tax=Halorhodospira TaxID=85108 RepID=UPI00191190CB|nr:MULTISPECIES: flagellar basal body L-ring protein FlgH [Halorhodospira]MBK5942836.1 hypothetical protein [Halorhodospira halophila]MCC3750524.1 flagellar basal body L-ring protein FlgH [Halorhodospira halophila]MCG5528796.1 flagellar basal body L-ring protein FlgH [Halorhodospira halophila]MCG5533467.1 flagellar basal body L-ring protein FlgH [Halorhodospira sp. 9621]MCG5543293.1 flagellar basal body L-ring protein FlgH [Halorhodospira sp. 9628]